MVTERPNTETVLQERIRQEMADSFDEELEMEIDDDRLDKVLVDAAEHPERETLDRRTYFKELFRLQGELIKLQDWVAHEKCKIVILFEGRDAAGKGGVIRRITIRHAGALQPACPLVTTGIHGWSRNPIYVGSSCSANTT